jgi:LmbE family N-acetylglucosaminyl deacetylase
MKRSRSLLLTTGALGLGLCAAFWIRTLAAAPQPAVPRTPPKDGKLRIIAFGAHPDDAEIRAGGVGAMWAARGHHVKLVSMTNGDQGHYVMSGGALARRRKAEVQRASEILGTHSHVCDIHDGELMPTLENRRLMVDLIREWQADIVISSRPYDYHPDHRAVGQLAQDAAFMVTVPFYSVNTPVVEPNPVFLYSADNFKRPVPFRADIVVSIDEVFQKKIDALDALVSQFYETVYGVDEATRKKRLSEIPKDPKGRRAWLEKVHGARYAATANQYREALIKRYGPEKGKNVKYAEAFEICEYGRQPTEEEIRKLFPFFP